jgi:uncharacterized membrane protein YgcG
MRLDAGMKRLASGTVIALALAAGSICTSTASAQGPSVTATPSSGNPQRDTLLKLMKPITIELKDQRLEDVIKFVAELTGAEIDAMWLTDREQIGMDKEYQVSLKANNIGALTLLERVLDLATSDTTGAHGMTWQMSEGGALQIGPRERLNKFRRVEIYDINDMLMTIPEFTDAPQFDLNNVLQGSGGRGGGGSSQSPFRQSGGNRGGGQNQPGTGVNGQRGLTKPEKAEELKNLIISLVEPDQWVENGYEAASIKYYQNVFIVNAPDYVHRALDGYPFWPKRYTTFGVAESTGRRYVTLTAPVSSSKINGITQTPVTAVTGGGGAGPTPPPGGGR